MAKSPVSLAAAFPPATEAQWRALAEKGLKGRSLEDLVRRTADGIVIAPLYAPAVTAGHPIPARGSGRPWDIRIAIAQPDPGLANRQALEALEGGGASILLTHPCGAPDGGPAPADLPRILEGMLTDVAPIAVDGGFLGPFWADALSAVAKASPAAPLAFHLDPLSAFAVAGRSPGPIEAHLIAAANTAARLVGAHPRATLFLASGKAAHEAGGSEAWELAFVAASTLAYAKALVRAGLPMTEVWPRIVVGLAVDAQPFLSIAKLRAARVILGRLAEASGAPNARVTIEARSSQRMLVGSDPWTNVMRLTAAAFAAAVGGADVVVLGAFTDAIGLPTDQGLRLARNTQLILMEEAHVGAVADPLAGSGAIETLTADLAEVAWTRFQQIEAAGGAVEALRGGSIAAAVAEGRKGLTEAIASGARRILGVTEFKDPEPPSVRTLEPGERPPTPSPDPRLPGPDSHCPALGPLRFEALAA